LTILLDARTSQHASFANSINMPLAINTPDLIGVVGLNVSNPGSTIRVELTGTFCLQLSSAPIFITITVHRGALATDHLVYSANQEILFPAQEVITFSAADYNPPAPVSGLLIYTMFVRSNGMGAVRVGPENFNAAAYSDDPV